MDLGILSNYEKFDRFCDNLKREQAEKEREELINGISSNYERFDRFCDNLNREQAEKEREELINDLKKTREELKLVKGKLKGIEEKLKVVQNLNYKFKFYNHYEIDKNNPPLYLVECLIGTNNYLEGYYFDDIRDCELFIYGLENELTAIFPIKMYKREGVSDYRLIRNLKYLERWIND